MKIGVVAYSVIDFFLNVPRRMVFQPDDGGTLHTNAVLAQIARKLARIGALQLGVLRTWGLETHPEPRDAQFHQLLHRVFPDRIGGRKNRQSPTLPSALHAVQ